MERRVNKRKISKDRIKKERKPKNTILIALEGKNKTEKIYFNNFDDGKKPYSILFAKGSFTDPLNLVKILISEINEIGLDLSNKDKAYCVFDTDTNKEKDKLIKEAKQLAKENNIEIITSTPSFELWFLMHYEYTTALFTNKSLLNRLQKHNKKYEKNYNIYNEINNKTNKTIEREKKLINYQIENGKTIGTVDANPSTEVYKVVEDLL